MIVELLRNRFSVRKYQDRPIPPAILQTILEAGRLSPSGGNEQSWIFGVITDSELIADIAKLAYRQTWIAQAPLLIVLCTIGVGDDRGGRDVQRMRYPDYTALIDRMDQELYWALNQEEHQTKIVGTHMALAALEHGIGSCWVSQFEVKPVARLLNLPEDYLPSEILVFGYPKANDKTSVKKSLDEVVFYNHFSHAM
jgi:nitroreductase